MIGGNRLTGRVEGVKHSAVRYGWTCCGRESCKSLLVGGRLLVVGVAFLDKSSKAFNVRATAVPVAYMGAMFSNVEVVASLAMHCRGSWYDLVGFGWRFRSNITSDAKVITRLFSFSMSLSSTGMLGAVRFGSAGGFLISCSRRNVLLSVNA